MERRLAAIMATDVVGYSRLIRADEEGTIATLIRQALEGGNLKCPAPRSGGKVQW